MLSRNVASPYIVGPPIQNPERFIGRRSQIRRFLDNLLAETPHSMWVRGIRRSGKSSFLRYVAHAAVMKKELSGLENPPLIGYVDLLAAIREPVDFYRAVATALCRASSSVKGPGDLSFFRQFDSFISDVESHFRPVILLDELDSLADRAEFDSTFWLSLRALGQSRVVWIPATYRHIEEFTRKPGEITSPFYNVFHIKPLILGSLSDGEAATLVSRPAESLGVHFSTEEVQSILGLAGGLPYLLQATADAWFSARTEGVLPERCYDTVLSELLDPRSLIPDIFGSCWRHLNVREQQCLERAALGKDIPGTREYQNAQVMLSDFGLMSRTFGKWEPSGELLKRWLGSERYKKGLTTVFIGHGHMESWRMVRDFLEDRLHLRVICYETEPREGYSIVNILEDMLNQAEYAIIVLTAEDQTTDGGKRARQNVIHEAGYCQGRLGFQRVVLLKQKGVENLSNLDGLQYIEFDGDRIGDTFPSLLSFLLH